MAKIFDATLKDLIDGNPTDWVRFAGREIGLPEPFLAEPLDADLSTFSPQADKLFRISGSVESLLHLELQSGWDGGLPNRALLYNVLAETRYSLPVYSALILLDRRAESSAFTGTLEKKYADGRIYLSFQYTVIRVWRLSIESLLQGGAGTLPLAMLTDEAALDLPGSFFRFDERLKEQVSDQGRQTSVCSAAFILMGLRYDENLLNRLFGEVTKMRESSTYQAILREGRAEGRKEGRTEGRTETLRFAIIATGEERFGSIMPVQQTALDAISDFDRLTRILRRLITAANWDEVLSTP